MLLYYHHKCIKKKGKGNTLIFKKVGDIMARTSRYDIEIKPHIKEIKEAVEAGATIEEIAKAFGISVSTLYKYKSEQKELKEAFARGREKIVFEIKSALLKKALGFNYEEEKRVGRKDKNGEDLVVIEKYKRYCPPSETAAAMLLRNYCPEWLDSDNTSTQIKKQKLELEKAIAESTNFDLNLGETNNVQ